MLGIEECRRSARERGGECLSTTYEGSKKPLLWRCAAGHEWEAIPNSVRNGHWCERCANEEKSRANTNRSIEEMDELARARGGRCLSTVYRNVNSILEWECGLKHVWPTAAANVIAGRWCPTCSRGLSERLCRHIFAHLFSAPFPTVRPKWLLGEQGHSLELDGYCEQYKIAFEYHGAQHYVPVKQFKLDAARLAEVQARDAWKRDACRRHGLTLIEIPYTVAHAELESFIRESLVQAGIEHAHWETLPFLKLDNVGLIVDPRLNACHEMAAQQEGKCLSPQHLGQKTDLQWQCQHGHTWESTPYRIRKGWWCPDCRKKGRAAAHNAQTLQKVHDHLQKLGSRLLSTTFEGQDELLQILCGKGHEWSTSWASLRHGTKCPHCPRPSKPSQRARKRSRATPIWNEQLSLWD
ncbi:hypothetical protein [Cupriavidus sp. IK-TO18]|uniref:hypothetical protein n=1 Tax=Cupriavidus sp. IK-TO18 TaxID=2782182 RepID=UPI001898E24B|nr:hypothetical protein [Cupriavidus sp. IK-TO18]MBF6986497.1 hypothetical protein [Cupriavidus sp. IK-TO18]